MPTHTTRVRLTAAQKLALCERHSDHPELSLRALCAWAGAAFKLPRNPSPAALLMLFKQPLTEDAVRANPARKTSQCVYCPSLEHALVRWIKRCELLQMPVVTWATIRAKAVKIRSALMRDAAYVPNIKLKSMMFSDGWFQKLQERHGLKPQRVHGETASARAADVDVGRAALRIITSKYSPCDIFNMDETAYFYCMAPATSVTSASISGRKKIKKRLTVAITTNADGSCKVPLLFIGTARQPRCFSSQSASELGIDYTNATKGWITTELFRSSLAHFNETMQGEDRYVLLLLDNASPHRVSEHLSNATLHFLPPNTTAHLQPQNAGIIQSFKSQLNKIRSAYVVDKLDELLEQVDEVGKENVELNAERLFNMDPQTQEEIMLDELPGDVWPKIVNCLTGVSLFDLARVNRWTWQCFSQDVYWRDRLTANEEEASNTAGIDPSRDSKWRRWLSRLKTTKQQDAIPQPADVSPLQQYMRAYSVRLQGLSIDTWARSSNSSCVELIAQMNTVVRLAQKFSFDLWFCLLDGDGDNSKITIGTSTLNVVYTGGVIFGAQSVPHDSSKRVEYHQQYVVVSADKKLYCSILDKKPEIASDLQLHRWYHLALTFDGTTQLVYLDGRLKSTVEGLRQGRRNLSQFQLGAGWVSDPTYNRKLPALGFSGWYPFNGMIDSFRWWHDVLSSEDVQALATGKPECVAEIPLFSMKRDGPQYFALRKSSRVNCSRPGEQVVEIALPSRHKGHESATRRAFDRLRGRHSM